MQTPRIAAAPRKGIHRDEAAKRRIQIPRSEVVEREMAVKELACVEVLIRSRTGFVKQISKGIVGVGIGDNARCVGEGASAAEAVIVVIAGGGS